jgi:ferredoxin
MNICCCCGCCCGVLRSIRSFPKPAEAVSSAFIVELDTASCEGCGTCESRCQMQALGVEEGKAALNHDRCIGCGLCVTTCPAASLSLHRRPSPGQPKVPRDGVRSAIRLARVRGRLSVPGLALMVLQSKADRLRALAAAKFTNRT